jgi:hypothetical protein
MTALNASGSAPIYAARAWVNFNGTGTVAIRASGNVTSITDNGTGDYTINFTTAMPDINYSVVSSNSYTSGNPPANTGNAIVSTPWTPTSTSNARVVTLYTTGTVAAFDTAAYFVAIFR